MSLIPLSISRILFILWNKVMDYLLAIRILNPVMSLSFSYQTTLIWMFWHLLYMQSSFKFFKKNYQQCFLLSYIPYLVFRFCPLDVTMINCFFHCYKAVLYHPNVIISFCIKKLISLWKWNIKFVSLQLQCHQLMIQFGKSQINTDHQHRKILVEVW